MNDINVTQIVSGTVSATFTDEEFSEYKIKLINEFKKGQKKFNNLKYYFDIFIELDIENMNKDSVDFYVNRSKDTLLSHVNKSMEKHPEFAQYRKLFDLLGVNRTANKADICLRVYIIIF